jgi:hypothetical protein
MVTRILELKSGGEVHISASNMLTMSKADRDFVFRLIDAMIEYEHDRAMRSAGMNTEKK